MRLVEFVSEAQEPGTWSRIKAKFGSSEDQGKIQTHAEFSKIFKAFETWLGRSGLEYEKTLTVEKFKLNFGKTPNLDQALENVGITEPYYKLKKSDVEKIIFRVTQLKDQVVSKPVEPPAPDPAEEKAKQDRLGKVREALTKLSGTTKGRNALDTKESKKLEKVIKDEVSKSLQKAIEIGIYIIQLSKKYDVEHLISLWYNAVETGEDWETLKETQNKVKLSET